MPWTRAILNYKSCVFEAACFQIFAGKVYERLTDPGDKQVPYHLPLYM